MSHELCLIAVADGFTESDLCILLIGILVFVAIPNSSLAVDSYSFPNCCFPSLMMSPIEEKTQPLGKS